MTVTVVRARLGAGVDAYFTGRDPDRSPPAVGAAGNLSHRRPHRPVDLARDRREVADRTGVSLEAWHLMEQVHGPTVAEVGEDTAPNAELRRVDALVTSQAARALVVQVADCVPVLLAGHRTVGAVHAGRQGVANGIVAATVARLEGLGEGVGDLRAAIGPAIGGCCYEVPADLRAQVAADVPAAWATTRWGTPSLDLPAAVEGQLATAGVTRVQRLDVCTFEDEAYFSHRRDPGSGRQVGIVVRREGT